MQHKDAGVASLAKRVSVPLMQLPSAGYGRNLEFSHGAGDSSPTLREAHHGIFNVHQLMSADATPSLTSIRGTAHTLMNHTLPVKHRDDIL